MPIAFSTSLEIDLVCASWSGVIGLADFRENFLAYLSDAHYRPGRTELIDLSQVEDFDVDFKKVWAAMRMTNDQPSADRPQTRSVVIAPDDMVYGMARMYQTLAENAGSTRLEIFRTEADALAALGLPYQSVIDLRRSETFLSAEQREA